MCKIYMATTKLYSETDIGTNEDIPISWIERFNI